MTHETATAPRPLRPYQTEAVEAVESAFRAGTNRPAVVLPTGTGKSTVLGRLAANELDRGGRVLMVAHRTEIVDQLADNVAAVTGRDDLTGIVQGERNEVTAPVVCATVQSISRPDRLRQLENIGLVIVDECHHAVAPTYLRVLGGTGCFEGTRTVGVTATLSRGDEKVLGEVWQDVVYQKSIAWAIDEGYLVRPRGKSVVIRGLDLGSVKRTGGDWQDGDLGEAIAAHAKSIATALRTHGSGRRTIAFVPSVESAFEVRDALDDEGFTAAVVVGDTPRDEREDIYAAFRSGDLEVIVSVAVLTEGFDMPATDCVLMARPTSMHHVYIQAVGRGLRPAPGKDDCLVLDVVGVARRFPLTTIADLGVPGVDTSRVTPEGDDIDDEEAEELGVRPPRRLRHVEDMEDVDLFRLSPSLWLHTNTGVRFIPAGEYIVFLWPMDAEGALYMPGKIRCKAPFTAAEQLSPEPLDLDTARAVAEANASLIDPLLTRREAGWRVKHQRPSDAQVRYAKRLGIPNPETFTKGALSDAMNVRIASQLLP